jgi:hypothetical protein
MRLLQILRGKFFMTIASLIVTVQLVNLSFDPADDFCGREDLSINEIESCVELVLEIVMGQDNAIEERDECDENATTPGASVVLYDLANSIIFVENVSVPIKNCQAPHKDADVESLTLPITSPPPKLL